MTTRTLPIVVSGLSLLLASCPARNNPVQQPAGGADPEDGDDAMLAAADRGLQFTLREGRPGSAAAERLPVAPATSLGEREIKALLARLPALAQDGDDIKEFALRPASQPPPRTGTTVLASFPGKGTPPVVKPGALSVLRHSPDGEVPVAADLSITFSQPMVAVTSHDQLKASEVPVKLTPAVPGEWQWLGTRTLVFRPTGRFPMASEYRVDVPAGTAAAGGGKLSQGTSFSFATPPPRLLSSSPGGTTTRTPKIFLAFDQRIDPAAVLPAIRVHAKGGEPSPLRIVPLAEARKDKDLRALLESAEDGRWLVVQPTRALPPDSDIQVVLAAGLPSAEGPRKTTAAQQFGFHTYGALALQSAECGWGTNTCDPGMPFRFTFSNEIDARRFKKEWVRVTPDLPGLSVAAYGNEIHIQGQSKPRTKYQVTIDAGLRDAYGQTLGKPVQRAFTVGPAPDSLYALVQQLTVLDPAAPGKLSVFTTGHKSLKVKIHAVAPADWDAYMTFLRARNEDRLKPVTPPGKPVFSDTIRVTGDPDDLSETTIDLASALPGGLGHAIIIVEPSKVPKEPWMRAEVITWAQATRIGVDAFVDGEKMVAFTTRLADGAPLPGVQLQLLPSGAKASAGPDGLATLPLPAKGNRVLLATQGQDSALLPEQVGWWYGDADETGWRPHKRPDALHWYVIDDRQMYRPGETARIKGWLRSRTGGLGGGLVLPSNAVKEIRYTLHDSQGNKLLTGTRTVSALGGFDLSLTLPKTPNLGYANLELAVTSGTMKGQTWSHGLQIQEFRRPEYEVSARVGEGPHLVGGHADLTVSAQYFSGGPLANAEVAWQVSANPGAYSPPGHDGYTFGRWIPWWGWGMRGGHFPGREYRPPEEFAGRTDSAGEHHLRADFHSVDPIEATSVHAEATVLDVNRQAWTSGVDLLVHPSSLYVGMKSERLFVQQGEPLHVDAIVTDIDGKQQQGPDIEMRAVRVAWEQDGGDFKEVEKDPQDCKQAARATDVRCTFIPKVGGTYRVTARVADAKGRKNESQLTLWVAGGDQPPSRGVEQQEVQLIPDKKEYAAGDSAKLLVLAPFAPAEGVLTLRREGLISTRRFTLKSTSTTLEIPIDDAHAPNLRVQVDLVGAAPRTQDNGQPDPSLPRRPAFAVGEIGLPVPPRSRSLNLYLKPGASKLEPGGTTQLEVLVHDARDQPVRGSEVAVIVVDEAVLALSDYQLADPLAAFYPALDPGVADYHSRASVTLARPADASAPGGEGSAQGYGSRDSDGAPSGGAAPPPPAPAMEPAPQSTPADGKRAPKRMANGANNSPAPAIAVRSNFDALALFAAALPTDAQGRAQVEIKLPDNLTRYRIMAVAVAGADRFGKAESNITARLPLMVRPSPPRFLNFGDRFELPIVLQNQTDAPMTVELAARTSNLDLTAGAGRKVQVPANDRVEVRLPAAAVKPGTARFQVAAAAGKWSDAATGSLPVWTPATTEAFATYGQIDAGAQSQPIAAPADVVPGFGGLEITTSSTAVAELTDAVLYLVRYPFECSEQLASRMITIAALRDVLTAFNAPGMPKQAELLAFVDADIDRLTRLQNPDGGFAFWRRGDPSWPYLTVHVAHALERARSKGFKVPPAVLDRAQDYLKTIESKFESWYTPEIKRPIVAYALYVRARLGVRDTTRARSLYNEVAPDKHSLETLGWLLPVLPEGPESKAILRHVANQVRETAGAAHFTTAYSDGAHLLLHSERRVDGVLLEALIGADPKSDLIPKLVRGLLSHRVAGRWNNTQENAFVLLALDRYFSVYEAATPDFLARAWLGNKGAGEHRFKGRTTEQSLTVIPMPALLKEGKADLVLSKDGPGRLYYRLGLRYAPKSLALDASEHGFVVERKYEGLDDPKDVRRDPDGTWRIKAGARVQVSLTMVAQDRRYHVALVDPLPAGLEAINPALATSGTQGGTSGSGGPQPIDSISPLKRGGWWWWRDWYDHQNLRDERVEAFTTLLWDGVHNYSYTARATTPGTFVVPPAKAEEMYAPETFGRSSSDRVIVE